MTLARHLRAWAWPLATAAAGLLAVSCVLLVSPATYGDRCKLEGEGTACGSCLRDRCQPSIDACCKEDGCSGALSTLEGCALRTDGSCAELAAMKSAPGQAGALATCATTLCSPVCRSFTGTSDTKCSEPPLGRSTTCSCMTAPGAGNAFDCSPESYPGTICCAPESWPASGLECRCLPLGCYPTPEGCSCSLVDTPPDQTECTATTCCTSLIDPDQCVCRRACFENERQVPSCSVTAQEAGVPAIGCKKGQKRVDSCTLRR